MNKIIQILKKSELYFIFALVLLNLYCAFALIFGGTRRRCNSLDDEVIMLMFANDKILEKLEKKVI